MSEWVRRARFAVLLLLIPLLAGAPGLGRAEGGAATAEPSAAPEEAVEPPAGEEPAGAGNPDVVPDVVDAEEPEPVVPGERLLTIPSDEAAGILGKWVIGAAGEGIGMVVDVLVDHAGRPRAAVVDFGGFLGVGTRKIAVDWTFLQFRPGDRAAPVLLDVTADAIRAAPEYRPSDADSSVVVAPPAEDPAAASSAEPEAGPAAPAGTEAAPAGDAPPPSAEERAEPPPPPATAGPARPPLPEMKPPDGRPKDHPPAAGLPAGDLGPAPAPALPPTPPDARQ